MTHPRIRQQRLLAHLQQAGPGTTTSTGQVRELYADWGIGPQRSTARGDLKALAAQGHLIQTPGHNTTYRLNHAAKEQVA